MSRLRRIEKPSNHFKYQNGTGKNIGVSLQILQNSLLMQNAMNGYKEVLINKS